MGSFPWQEHCVLAYSQFSECKVALNAQAGMKLPRSRNPQSRVTEIISIALVFNNWVFFLSFLCTNISVSEHCDLLNPRAKYLR